MVSIGDKCSVPITGGARHYGICVGFDQWRQPRFIHNSFARGGVTTANWEEFSDRKPIRVDDPADDRERHLVVRRAKEMLGRKYNFLLFNCEHAANLAFHGRSFSTQMRSAGGLVALGIGLLVVGARRR